MTLGEIVANVERSVIERALREQRGNISAMARILGLTRRGLMLKMRRLGVARG